MMKKFFLVSLMQLVGLMSFAYSQDFVGFWGVEKVTVGDRIVTPVAKWFQLDADQSYQSGNGWLQNDQGKWVFDLNSKSLSLHSQLGLEDEFEPFKVYVSGSEMILERKEEGMDVKVILKRIKAKPISTSDLLHGLWDLEKVEQDGKDISSAFDPEGKYYLFIRWDRIYSNRNAAAERKSGFWHIDAHKPELTLLPHESEAQAMTWKVEVTEAQLRLSGISRENEGKEMFFRRLHQFPD